MVAVMQSDKLTIEQSGALVQRCARSRQGAQEAALYRVARKAGGIYRTVRFERVRARQRLAYGQRQSSLMRRVRHVLEPSGHGTASLTGGCQRSNVIIAKLDRLTRSMADLGELLNRFERRGVSLVSDSLDTRFRERPSGAEHHQDDGYGRGDVILLR
jgi:hypothetical protein